MATKSWNDWLKELICRLYRAWGGGCGDLGELPSQWVAKITTTYALQGVPSFADQAAIDAFLLDLDALEVHLDSPHNTLSPADNIALRTMIESLRAELDGE